VPSAGRQPAGLHFGFDSDAAHQTEEPLPQRNRQAPPDLRPEYSPAPPRRRQPARMLFVAIALAIAVPVAFVLAGASPIPFMFAGCTASVALLPGAPVQPETTANPILSEFYPVCTHTGTF
jgi:hypothetical protein